jgi:ferredoxin-NADP reductase
MKEYTVKIVSLTKITPSAATLRMTKPEGFAYKPGQWGYFTVLKDGEKVSRSLTFSSSPTEPYLEFTKRLSDSLFCSTVEELKAGDTVSFKGPMGNLVYEGGLDKVTFLAGGIGITPVRSILKNAADKKIPGEKVLIYGNLNLEEIAFAGEIETWERDNPGLKVVHVLEKPPADWTGFTGFITADVIREAVTDLDAQAFFVSGPPAMVQAVTGALARLGIPDEKVIQEELTGYEGMV